MNYYRDIYLKSEEWKSLRMEKIFKDGFRCKLCGKRPKKITEKFGSGFNVHHLKYRNLHDVQMKDLRTLCFACHKKVHALMLRYPKMKKLPGAVQWHTALYHLCPERREKLAGQVNGIAKSGKVCSQRKEPLPKLAQDVFGAVKSKLFKAGIICKSRMVWRDSFGKSEELMSVAADCDRFLAAYIKVSGRDPRRLVPDIYRPWVAPFSASKANQQFVIEEPKV